MCLYYLCDFTFMWFLVSSYSNMILILSARNHAFLDLLFSLPVHFLVCSSVCKSNTQFSFVREYVFLDTCLREECKCGEWCMNDWCFSSGNLWELSLWGLWWFFNLYFRAIHASSHSVKRQLWSWLKCLHKCCLACEKFLDPQNLNLQLALVIYFFLCLSTIISLISCNLQKYYVHYLMNFHHHVLSCVGILLLSWLAFPDVFNLTLTNVLHKSPSPIFTFHLPVFWSLQNCEIIISGYFDTQNHW